MRSERKMENGITIYAAAQGKYAPDVFTIEVSFTGEKENRDECVQAYNEDYRKVKEALISAGVPEESIVTGPFAVMAHYEWIYEKIEEGSSRRRREEYRRIRKEIDGYEYEGNCSAELPMNASLAKTIWVTLRDCEGDFGFDFSYDLEHPEVHERALLEQAVSEAKERAEVLASAAGIKLGAVEAIEHEYRHAVQADQCVHRSTNIQYMDTARNSLEENAPDFDPEHIWVSCDVSIRWKVG